METKYIIGIDASNIRTGGGLTHLVELLSVVNPILYGFNKIVVWSSLSTLAHIKDKQFIAGTKFGFKFINLQTNELTFIIKPIRFLYLYFNHYFKIGIMTLILTAITLIYCVFLLRKSSFINIKIFFGILSLIMLFAMIPPIVVYSSAYIIATQSLILTICIYYLIAMLLLYLCKKLNIIE